MGYFNTVHCITETFVSANLGVRKLMDATTALDREVAPHVWGVSEAELIDRAAGGLEAIISVL